MTQLHATFLKKLKATVMSTVERSECVCAGQRVSSGIEGSRESQYDISSERMQYSNIVYVQGFDENESSISKIRNTRGFASSKCGQIECLSSIADRYDYIYCVKAVPLS